MILLVCTAVGAETVGAGRPGVRPEAALVRMLIAPPSPWGRSLAQQFVKTIPARIIEPLANQTAKTIPFYITKMRVPKTGLQNEFFCWASVGSGGGYAAIIRREGRDYTLIWDSLIPPAFIAPRVEFMDVDGDSTVEIICAGECLEGGVYEWAILRWDGINGRLLAPRLDRPSPHIWYNRLIGRSLKITDTPGSTAKTLILTLGNTPWDSTLVSDSTSATRVFRYDKTDDGFFPPL